MNLRTEAVAGITTFFTMAYIVVVNPTILSTPGTGMAFSGVLTATVLICFTMTLMMGLTRSSRSQWRRVWASTRSSRSQSSSRRRSGGRLRWHRLLGRRTFSADFSHTDSRNDRQSNSPGAQNRHRRRHRHLPDVHRSKNAGLIASIQSPT